ncbi:response regulator transcription factor [Cohnella algarum]|uniref:response regulator transcription factor n=1 Tax=Cohnella algarum TaxID=2044859 RepID=UPI001968958D|nr:response regulator [Cohnella algarum]MBN2983049.1 response regulator [Cohnella algarum]
MYNVLIAEDSKPILRNIKGLVESSGLPVRVVATAANGEEALAAFGLHAIDIMLTDIRMPKMDGLALIDQAKKLHPQLKAVLISGYNDFEYTRKAINLQVNDYLLKPVEKSQLTEVMKNLLAQLAEEQDHSLSGFHEILDRDAVREWRPGPEFYREPKIFFVIRKQPFAAAMPVSGTPFEAAVPDAAIPSWALPTIERDQLLLIADASWLKRSESSADLIEDVRSRLLDDGAQASLVGCLTPTEWTQIPEKYREAARLLDDRQLVFKPVALDFALYRDDPEPSFEEVDRLGGAFAAMIEQMNKDRFMLMLSEQVAKWKRGNVRFAELKRFVRSIESAFESLLEEGDGADAAGMHKRREDLFGRPSYEEFGSGLLEWAEECFSRVKSSNRKSGDELFEQMDGYLRTNLYSSVSIPDLVRLFHVSSSYISRIIKRFSGKTFVHYYTEMKINEACKLMETKPEMKIREIAEALCFADQHYFSKVFKERVGVSPLEYKMSRTGRSDTE